MRIDLTLNSDQTYRKNPRSSIAFTASELSQLMAIVPQGTAHTHVFISREMAAWFPGRNWTQTIVSQGICTLKAICAERDKPYTVYSHSFGSGPYRTRGYFWTDNPVLVARALRHWHNNARRRLDYLNDGLEMTTARLMAQEKTSRIIRYSDIVMRTRPAA